MSIPTPVIQLSQEQLFFPLPLTSPVENIVQITNATTSSSAAGASSEMQCVAFRIMSSVRSRYAVKPTMGFLSLPGSFGGSAGSAASAADHRQRSDGAAAGGRHTEMITFLLDPQYLEAEQKRSSEAVTLPDGSTKDTIIIDVAIVTDVTAVQQQLQQLMAAGADKGAKTVAGVSKQSLSAQMTAAASSFWKTHGKLKIKVPKELREASQAATYLNDGNGGLRIILRCSYGDKSNLPDNMRMRLTSEESRRGGSSALANSAEGAGRMSAPAPPQTRAHTGTENVRSGQPPPPTPPSSVTNRRAGPSTSASAINRQSRQPAPATTTGTIPTAASVSAAAPVRSVERSAAGGGQAAATAASVSTTNPTQVPLRRAPLAAAASVIGPVGLPSKGFVRDFLMFRIPLPVVGGLILISFLCALFERDSILLSLLGR